MAESTKILQVTYGSYSCTLEGFEDPVEAMIAVTEYFRELADRDPVFAAVAEEPRAEDLARLADRIRAERIAAEDEPVVSVDTGIGLGPVTLSAQSPKAETPESEASAVEPDTAAGGHTAEHDDGETAKGAEQAAPVRPSDKQMFLATPPDADEAALSRILSESDARLSDPEAARRRATIASLKAAVAATEAGRAGDDTTEREKEARRNTFRSDLRQVVGTQAAARLRSMPLRLVASQRVDLPPEPPRPEEEAQALPAPSERASDFASFAAEMGAKSLPDLIEAAAAWRAFVWELDDVSRPELLKLATEALAGEPSREESLGAFGSLLRDGRLDRVSSGRFRIRDSSRFNPGRMAG